MAQFGRFAKNSLVRLVSLGRRSPGRLSAWAGVSSILSYQAESGLGRPEASLKLENIQQKWSHKYLLQQSSVLNVESASVTLTQTVVALQACAQSYCSHLAQLTGLLTMSSDGLPLAYSNQELYDMVVELRGILQIEKEALLELGVLFTYVRKLLDSVAETAFLVGAEYASLQASSRLATAEAQVKEELGMADRAEQELLQVERDNVIKIGKEKKEKKLDPEWVKGEVEKLDNIEIPLIPNTDEVKVTVKESENTNDEGSPQESFTFDRNSDELIKITVRQDEDDFIKISIKEDEDDNESEGLEDEENDLNNPPFKYKMPTF
eukprot:GFUD01001825.1.p1 GENE.GFUD01001825.1~~GFUD01001825.1.p1  ORF type:complete len:322 (-),score=132.62 GFUD01001825.1:198-1163(-)